MHSLCHWISWRDTPDLVCQLAEEFLSVGQYLTIKDRQRNLDLVYCSMAYTCSWMWSHRSLSD